MMYNKVMGKKTTTSRKMVRKTERKGIIERARIFGVAKIKMVAGTFTKYTGKPKRK